jgi:hypothetical protein
MLTRRIQRKGSGIPHAGRGAGCVGLNEQEAEEIPLAGNCEKKARAWRRMFEYLLKQCGFGTLLGWRLASISGEVSRQLFGAWSLLVSGQAFGRKLVGW